MSIYDFRRSLNLSMSAEHEEILRKEVKKLTKKESRDLTEFDLEVIGGFFGWSSKEYEKNHDRWFALHRPKRLEKYYQRLDSYNYAAKGLTWLAILYVLLLISIKIFMQQIADSETLTDLTAVFHLVFTYTFFPLLILIGVFNHKIKKELDKISYIQECDYHERTVNFSELPNIEYVWPGKGTWLATSTYVVSTLLLAGVIKSSILKLEDHTILGLLISDVLVFQVLLIIHLAAWLFNRWLAISIIILNILFYYWLGPDSYVMKQFYSDLLS